MPIGTPIFAAGDGTVTQAVNDRRHCNPNNYTNFVQGCINAGFGNSGVRLTIQHSSGRTSTYLHLDAIASGIGVGTQVQAGQRIASSGNTGISTGPHLHYAEHVDGQPVDPGTWLACHGATRHVYSNLQHTVSQNVRNDGFACSTGPDPSQPLRNGELAQVRGEAAVYAVSAGTRWHVPDPAELQRLRSDPYYTDLVRTVNPATRDAVALNRPRDGSLLQERGAAAVFLFAAGTRWSIPNPTELAAVRRDITSDDTVHRVPAGRIQTTSQNSPRDRSLLQERGNAGVFLFTAGTRWSIPNPTELAAVRRDITSDDTVHRVPAGRIQTTSQNSPRDGSLLQERGNAGVYLFTAGTRWLVRNPAELEAVRRDITADDTVYRVPAPRLSAVTVNRPPDGALLRERDRESVYRIENGRKRRVGTTISHPDAIPLPAGVLSNVADVPPVVPVDPEPRQPSPPDSTSPVSLDPACSGAPTSGFTDTRGSGHAGPIDCIAWWGVTTGYPDGTYRPTGSVTRAQMATFIANALESSGVDLPDAGVPFPDTRGNTHEEAIGRLATLGIVSGHEDGTYRPGAAVTRAQMASFIVRAYEVLAEQEMPAGSRQFPDIAGNVHETNINKVAHAGLAGGFTTGRYEPQDDVSRAQMGSFLARMLSLAVTEGHADPPS